MPQHMDDATEKLINHARRLSTRPSNTPISPLGCLGEALNRSAAAYPDKVFLTFYSDSQRQSTLTYAQFRLEVESLAAAMSLQLGLALGDRIATLAANDPRTVTIYFAAWLLGVTVCPVNAGEDDERVRFILQDSGAKAAFISDSQIVRYDHMRSELPLLSAHVAIGNNAPAGYVSYDDLLKTDVPKIGFASIPPETQCLIIYTSGTTGNPKGVVLDHSNLLADAHSIAEWHKWTPNDIAMCVLPIHHVNGTVVTLVTPVYAGGSIILNNRFTAAGFWHVLAKEYCSIVSVVPTVLAILCEKPADLASLDLSKFRHLICGAGPLTVELAQRFHHIFGKRIVHGYGLSETTCYSCFMTIDLEEGAYAHWMFECGYPSIGCPIEANEMAIHDPDGNSLAEDERGEIVIRGQNVMQCYFKRPDANRDTFAHGWFRSGDEGFYRTGEDGRSYFFITGRLKELIIRGGINYSTFEIDEVINRAPGVKAGMAVGFENSFYGEEVGAYVMLEAGAQTTEAEILSYCAECLPFTKRPKVVVFGETFPVTSTGKYQRNKLKPLFEQWRETQFRDGKHK